MVDFPPPPDDPAPPFGRTRHPFFLHEMIRRQAVAVQGTLATLPEAAAAIPSPGPGARLLFTGIGTSFHAALGAEKILSAVGRGKWPTTAVDAFDLIGPAVALDSFSTVVAFSSSGETAVTNALLARLKDRGVPTILITGTESSRGASLASYRLVPRYSTESSWTHSVSYTAALAAARVLAGAWVPDADWRGVESTTIVESVDAALALEPQVLELVERLANTQSILLLGSGAANTTAREGALKIREAAGRFVATGGVEEFLHGMLPSVSAASAVLAVTGTELEHRRAREAIRAASQVGAVTVLLDSSGSASGDGEWSVAMPFPELAAIPQVIPFQLAAYWLAVSAGRNPDVMGLDDARYLEARRGFGI